MGQPGDNKNIAYFILPSEWQSKRLKVGILIQVRVGHNFTSTIRNHISGWTRYEGNFFFKYHPVYLFDISDRLKYEPFYVNPVKPEVEF